MNMRSVLRTAVDEVRGYWQGPFTLNNPNTPLSAFWGGAPAAAGVHVSEETALRYSAVWSAVTQISQTLGSLPIGLYRKRGPEIREEFTDHPIHRLLQHPNPEISSMVFRETMQSWLLLWGNAYAEIQWNGSGQPQNLWQLHPSRVMPFRAELGGGRFGPIQYRVDGKQIVNAENMLHIPGFGGDGTVGYSVISAFARQNIGLGLSAEQFGASFFSNGAKFGGILTHPGKLGKDVKQGIRESIIQNHQGPGKANDFIILGEGMTYEQLGIPPGDSQFIENRKFGVTDVARWFNMPPHMLKDLERATFSNIEHQGIEFAIHTMRPWCVRWEEEVERKLIAPSERNIQYVHINLDALLRGDTQARYTAYGIGRDKGWLSADDIRAKEDMNPLPNGQGKLYLVQQAQVPVDKIADLIQSEIDKNNRPTPAPAVPNANRSEEIDALREEIGTLRQSATEHRTAVDTLFESVRDLHTVPNELRQHVADHLDTIKAQEQEIATKQALILLLTERSEHAEQERDVQLVQRVEAVSRAELAEAQATATEADLVAERTQAIQLREAVDAAETARIRADVARTHVEQERAAALVRAESAEQTAAETASALTKAEEKAGMLRVAMAAVEASDILVRADADTKTKALEDALTALHQAETDIDAARTAAETARQEATEARSDAMLFGHKLTAAEQAVKDADVARASAEQAATAAQDACEAQRQVSAERDARVVGAIRALFVDSMGRMVRRETEKARRNLGTPAKLRAWAEGFYLLHGDTCVEALRPAVSAHLAWMGSDADVDATTRDLVGPHLKAAEQQIRAIADGDPDDYHVSLERLLTKWDTDRPNALADVILRKEIAHVSTV